MLKKQLPSEIALNYRITTKEGMFAAATTGLINPFLGIFAVAMGASNIIVGLITAVPALINFLLMIPAARYTDAFRAKMPLIFWGGLIARSFYLPMAAIPYLAGYRGELLIVLLTLMSIPAVIMNLSWTALMARLFPVTHRGQVFGQRNTWCGLVSMLATVAAGFLLDVIPHPFNWTVLFTAGAVSGYISSWIFRQHQEEPLQEIRIREPYLHKLRNMLNDPATGRRYAVLLSTSFLFHLGMNLSAPLFSIYFARTLAISNSLIGWMTTLMGLTTVLFSMYWGGKASLYGDDLVFGIGLLGMAIWPALFVINVSPIYMLAMHAILGVFVAAFNLTLFNLLLSSASYKYSSVSIATFHTVNSFTGIVGPFIGTWALNYIPIQQGFFLSTSVRVLALLVFTYGMRKTLLEMAQSFGVKVKKNLVRLFP